MQSTILRADERGLTKAGWLTSNHSFSFGEYHNPDQMGFGLLRVINDDEIAGGSGFPTHFHKDMEIITIPLEGSLAHKDSEGNEGTISVGDVQIMSAGSGIEHSEFNASATETGKFLQIWIETQKTDTTPFYDQISFEPEDFHNHFATLCSPNRKRGSLLIHQEAWLCMGRFDQWFNLDYHLRRPGHGVYVFVIEGSVELDGQNIYRRDAMAITDATMFNLSALEANTQILIIEVPLK